MYVKEIVAAVPTAERLLELTPPELDALLLRFMAAVADDPLRQMVTRNGIVVELFNTSGGELRNPKAHSDPTITDPLVAIEEMMTASVLLRIVG